MGNVQLIIRVGNNSVGLFCDVIDDFNWEYWDLDFEVCICCVYQDFVLDKIMVMFLFVVMFVYFLYIIFLICLEQKIYFIDIGYYFEEILKYKEYLIECFNLDVIDLCVDECQYWIIQDEQMWCIDFDLCCQVNKVQFLEDVKEYYDLWIFSLMGWQIEYCVGLEVFEECCGMIKFNLMIDVICEQCDVYIVDYDLLFYLLVEEGYYFIGCSYCIWKGEGCEGCWQGFLKIECGIYF